MKFILVLILNILVFFAVFSYSIFNGLEYKQGGGYRSRSLRIEVKSSGFYKKSQGYYNRCYYITEGYYKKSDLVNFLIYSNLNGYMFLGDRLDEKELLDGNNYYLTYDFHPTKKVIGGYMAPDVSGRFSRIKDKFLALKGTIKREYIEYKLEEYTDESVKESYFQLHINNKGGVELRFLDSNKKLMDSKETGFTSEEFKDLFILKNQKDEYLSIYKMRDPEGHSEELYNVDSLELIRK